MQTPLHITHFVCFPQKHHFKYFIHISFISLLREENFFNKSKDIDFKQQDTSKKKILEKIIHEIFIFTSSNYSYSNFSYWIFFGSEHLA